MTADSDNWCGWENPNLNRIHEPDTFQSSIEKERRALFVIGKFYVWDSNLWWKVSMVEGAIVP